MSIEWKWVWFGLYLAALLTAGFLAAVGEYVRAILVVVLALVAVGRFLILSTGR